LLRDPKPARNYALRTSLFVSFLVLAACQQTPTRPPVVDAPRAATTQPPPPIGSTNNQENVSIRASENIDRGATRSKQRWEDQTREIARTDLSDSAESARTPFEPAPSILEPMEQTPSDQLNMARLELEATPPESTMQRLNEIDFAQLTRAEKAEALRLKSESLRQLNLSIAALRTDAERLDFVEVDALDREIEDILGQIERLPPLIRGDLASGTDHLSGLASAWILSEAPDPESTSRWLRKFENHPLLLSQIVSFDFLRDATPPATFHITALLPLSGELANAGRAIRDGLLYAAVAHQKQFPIELNIRDSVTLTSDALKEIAAGSQTEFIIGPLQREKIQELLLYDPVVPVLALNRIEDTQQPGLGLAPVYSLSLAIEDDAETAVDYAGTEYVHPRLLTLFTDTILGRRAAIAVENQLQRIGGTDAGQFALDTKKPEVTISKALGVTDSLNRRRELSRMLNLALEHTPRTRQDVSTVVVQTDALGARQLRPLLDYYYLENTPVLFIGAFRSDLGNMAEDFKRSRILATPWELGSTTRDTLIQRPLAQGPFGTLTAIGKDALDMTVRLGFGEATDFAGETGYLRLGNRGLIERRLGTLNIDYRERISYSLWQPADATPLVYQDDWDAR
jgi:outer membrane PBP1 activator LpoA protein